MNLLLYGEIRHDIVPPDFGVRFRAHIAQKRNPDVFAASLTAWKLLEACLHSLGILPLPEVDFTENGKPYFKNSPFHFSLSHSGSLAAALISDGSCGLDIEIICPETEAKLRSRVLSGDELTRGENFFSVWTKKEATAKLTGRGMPSRPCEMNLSEYENMQLLQTTLSDSAGQDYFLSALCADVSPIHLRRHPEFPGGM